MIASLQAYAAHQIAAEQDMLDVECKICGAKSQRYDIVDFEKYVGVHPYSRPLSALPVVYRRCAVCAFVFTQFFDLFEPPDWSRYIYNDEYAKLDPEYEDARPRHNAKAVRAYLSDMQNCNMLDYGGGNGKTARLLRDVGWSCHCYDPFGVDETSSHRVYDIITCFEVFEHSPNPRATVQQMLDKATSGPLLIFFSTALTDYFVSEQTRLSWNYAAPRNGHISLYSKASLRALGDLFALDYSSVSYGTHILSRGFQPAEMIRRLRLGRVRLALYRKLRRF